jgi:hypothetical protein
MTRSAADPESATGLYKARQTSVESDVSYISDSSYWAGPQGDMAANAWSMSAYCAMYTLTADRKWLDEALALFNNHVVPHHDLVLVESPLLPSHARQQVASWPLPDGRGSVVVRQAGQIQELTPDGRFLVEEHDVGEVARLVVVRPQDGLLGRSDCLPQLLQTPLEVLFLARQHGSEVQRLGLYARAAGILQAFLGSGEILLRLAVLPEIAVDLGELGGGLEAQRRRRCSARGAHEASQQVRRRRRRPASLAHRSWAAEARERASQS